ncbi:peptidase S9 prolyl oligopeptidase active site domain protein [Beutenbergia cavernae DSM 12333]|uniref:Peptidase S9 prolyl oligopeptidase active site domain protein n=1 Tax=Beutenbergia cavernae (strain ATCC BAA-8 / DSM 12333 / CCUG 43141 / JCM 11478 / NBRC 16432 / NCIMB 13614 / HKI 0122) TaxID=471853 RepID=C5BYW3_BEUC1|nr:S9 family peptidase [Beutenbergia cavernae]ACQ79071.1 peptidase S9 prolyl oligopeptidase active site domain protein [Beutenbergia cavernae DSM 12333]
MTPENLAHLRAPGRPSVHPDGGWAAVAISRPDLDDDAYRSQVWRVPTDGGAPVRLTGGDSDSEPVISPDGRWLAFLRAGKDAPAQLALLDLLGGEARVLTDHRIGVGSRPAWSPDSRRIAYTARVPEPGRYGTKDGVGAGAESPRHITTYTYRIDNVGFTTGRPAHVFVLEVLDAPSPTDADARDVVPVRLTEGDLSHGLPVWAPDGGALLTVRSRDDALRGDLLRVAVPAQLPAHEKDPAADDDETPAPKVGEDPVRDGLVAVAEPLVISTPGSPAGVAFGERDVVWLLAVDLGEDDLDFVGRNAALWRGRLVGAELVDAARVTDPAVHDLNGSTGPGAFQVVDDRVLLTRVHRGDTELVLVEGDGAAAGDARVRVLLGGSAVVGADAIDSPPGEPLRVVVSAATADSPGDVVVVTDDSGEAGDGGAASSDVHVRPLTDLAAPLREAAAVRPPIELGGTAPDGYPLHGWLTLPDPAVHGAGPHPVLLNIHGGPYAAYGPAFFDETQVYAAAGYAVVYGNPRGSAGYGEAHGQAIRGRFGTVDADDVLALLDSALAAHPELDGERVGVLGGSYGGYMTAWLTTRTDRFAAAIVERGFLDPVSFVGSSDIGWNFGGQYLGEDPDAVAAQSPMAHLDRVTTPTLVIHSENDWRCPVEQGQRWYVGLRRRGIPSELLLFPGEGHELSRSGRPKHRRERFEHILAWWQRHLPVAPAAAEGADG